MKKVFWLFTALLFLTGLAPVFTLAENGPDFTKYLNGEYWRRQAINDIIPFWEKTVDEKNGGFFTDINRKGAVLGTGLKYPRMISRLVYGFSAAYLLSGDGRYLTFAEHGLDYLENYGWDQKYGGWHSELNFKNRPTDQNKDLFDETYGNLGPIFYYFVTGDERALSLVQQTHRLLKEKAWDKEYRGYYAAVGKDWSVAAMEKSFNSQIDTATAYLIYYYLSVKDPVLLNDLKEIGDTVIEHMVDARGNVHERFNRKWEYIGSYLGDKDQIEIGHNLKTTWVLLRIYQLTGERKYLECARKICDRLLAEAWDKKYYGWYFSKNANQPALTERERTKCWWTQTEGNFMALNMYRLLGEERFLDYFQKCSYFWDTFFIDRQYKEVYAYTSDAGKPLPGLKGDLYKSGYHTMEHALLNYLYLQLYVHKQTAELYFCLSAPADGVKHYVKIVEDPAVIIKSVEINGNPWEKFDAREGYVLLPKGERMKVKVIFGVESFSESPL